jgi:hypothetical protein
MYARLLSRIRMHLPSRQLSLLYFIGAITKQPLSGRLQQSPNLPRECIIKQ